MFIRFEGVYSNARIWINGHYIRSHIGGFTPFDCDITSFSGEKNITLVVGISDVEGSNIGLWNETGINCGDPSWASFYAHNNIGGILRDVTLFALGESFIGRTKNETVLMDCGAALNIAAEVLIPEIIAEKQTEIVFTLYDADKNVKAAVKEKLLPEEKALCGFDNTKLNYDKEWIEEHKESYKNDCFNEQHFFNTAVGDPADCSLYAAKASICVEDPILWNAEEPYLYTLSTALYSQGKLIQENRERVGLREICYCGACKTDRNKLYVNKKEVKLRGVCRHDISWKYGRSLTKEDELAEILAYKRNNINFIRTSHYPVTKSMLSLCDEYGIYVEQENAACFKGANAVDIYCAPQNFVSEFAEMVAYSACHPSVIIWSLGNESGFENTYAFRTEYNYIKKADLSRPVIFSYPDTVDTEKTPYDIFSMHYQDVGGALGLSNMPKLHDEFAHVPCYNIADLKEDNNFRNVWGDSIKIGWDNIFSTDGALGCAIWGGIDDVFLLPEGVSKRHQIHSDGAATGYGEWGSVLDIYKREKPEAYLTKKAFTPILIDENSIEITDEGLSLFVYNRFDHTDLKNITVVFKNKAGVELERKKLGCSVLPHQKKTIFIPAKITGDDETVLSFYHREVEVESILLKAAQCAFNNGADEKRLWMTCEESVKDLYYRTLALCIKVNKETGSVSLYDGKSGKEFVSNTSLYIKGILPPVQKSTAVKHVFDNHKANITIQKTYSNNISENIEINMTSQYASFKGKISFSEDTQKVLEKAGTSLSLNEPVDSVSWDRKGLYSIYPPDHIGRTHGKAYAVDKSVNEKHYGEKPMCCWSSDSSDFFLSDKLHSFSATRDFNTTRDNIKSYNVCFTDKSLLSVTADCGLSAAVNKRTDCDKLILSVGNYYPSISWGNDCGKPFAESSSEYCFKLSYKQAKAGVISE